MKDEKEFASSNIFPSLDRIWNLRYNFSTSSDNRFTSSPLEGSMSAKLVCNFFASIFKLEKSSTNLVKPSPDKDEPLIVSI